MHPPSSFTMLPMDEYKLLLVSIVPFLFAHLGSLSPYVLAQFDFYVDKCFSNHLCFHLSCYSLEKRLLADALQHPPCPVLPPREITS